MTTKKSLGKYSLELAVAIRDYHSHLLRKDGSRRKRHEAQELGPVTQ